jgi:hypothetical protein
VAHGEDGGQGVKISIMMEGKTEQAFMRHLRKYLQERLIGRMPRLDPYPYHGRIPAHAKLKHDVQLLLSGKNAADHVIALTDVYTGNTFPDFHDAADAKAKMRNWVGDEPRFHPHAAQYEFEAWLLPYWATIRKLAGHNRSAPAGNPENVNHQKPPAYHIQEIFALGHCRDSYVKPRDAGRILSENDLSRAIEACSELKAFVNTILSVCGGEVI